MYSRKTIYSIVLATVATLCYLWLTAGPLGITSEWTWDRIEYREPVDVLLRLIEPALAGGVYLAVAWFGCKRIGKKALGGKLLWWPGLLLAAFGWLWAVQDAAPAPHGLTKSAWVTYYAGSSGYFSLARYEMEDVPTFLKTYETRMAQGDVLHVGTHPPGLFLLHRFLIDWCTDSPTITRGLIATQPTSVVDGLDIIAENAAGGPRSLTQSDRAALWLASLLTQTCAVLAMIPLFGLLRRHCSATTSWQVTAFWPLLPALAIFLPKSDALLPLLGLSFLWLVWTGYQDRSLAKCAVAGMVLWLAMMVSLAILPVLVLALLLMLLDFIRNRSTPLATRIKQTLVLAGCFVCGFAIPVAFCIWRYELNLLAVWNWNYHNHAAFYSNYTRTYWKWLFVNPLELALAVGAPVFLLTAVALLAHARDLFKGRATGQTMAALACLLVWGLLWLSGKNMGEAARLWIVIQPWLVWTMARCFAESHETVDAVRAKLPTETDSPQATTVARGEEQIGAVRCLNLSSDWGLLLLLQMIVCWGTVIRVTGFNFGQQ